MCTDGLQHWRAGGSNELTGVRGGGRDDRFRSSGYGWSGGVFGVRSSLRGKGWSGQGGGAGSILSGGVGREAKRVGAAQSLLSPG
eukprot:scaffold28159_cov94-Isochrysis_galbana.AAC.3